jgi:protein ImuA
MPAALNSFAGLETTLPEHIAQALWRGHAMGTQSAPVLPTGHALLDAELPGGGWPCQALTEVLQAPHDQAEWRLLTPGLARLVAQGGTVLLVGPPQLPHLPGLRREGLREDRLVWIEARTSAERLWATEQALKAHCISAVLAWLPEARADQLRRLQACAMHHPGPVFVLRPLATQGQSSAAPLRLQLSAAGPGVKPTTPLRVRILKRRGPLLDHSIELPHWPLGLAPLIQRVASPHVVLDRPAARVDTPIASPIAVQ